MALKHYYIEDVSVEPMRENKNQIVPSIQFEETISKKDEIIISVVSGEEGKYHSVVRIPVEELKNAYDWLKEK